MLAALVAVVCFSYLAAQLTLTSLDPGLGVVGTDLVEAAVIGGVSGIGLWFGLFRRLRAQSRVQQFEVRVASAVQMATTEGAVHDVVRRAAALKIPRGRAQLLLADSSEAHLKVVTEHAADGVSDGCGVSAPFDCPAIRRAQTSRFESPSALDACPFLLKRPDDAGSLCIPMSVVGRSIGVLHITAAPRDLPRGSDVHCLETLTDQAGARLGLLRVMEQSHLQAATDPLTGLMNRRSLENSTRALFQAGRPFSLAMADLDHFKVLNDTYGHDAGDRALRMFARVAREALRSDDILSRYGGEEFVVVLPGLDPPDASLVLQRVQEMLARAGADGSTPAVTASWGVAHSSDANDLEELTRLADMALFRAKREGRNRIVLDRAPTIGEPRDNESPHSTQAPARPTPTSAERSR